MNDRTRPLFWSFPVGTYFLTRIRVSVFFPLIFLILAFRVGLHLGVVFGLILFGSVLLHEFGHIIAARLTGGSGDEILLWPLGGLASVRPASTYKSQMLTHAGGVIVNAALCLATTWPTYDSIHFRDAIDPFVLPATTFSAHPVQDVLVLIFCANWVLLLVNLIPAYPLDGGRLLATTLQRRSGRRGMETYLKVGFFLAFAMMILGLILDHTWLVFIGAVVVVLNMQEAQQMQTDEQLDDNFLGYDFSQGYTSLERDEDDEAPMPRPGFFARWRAKRQAERSERERARQQVAEQQLDELLDKVHRDGIDSLTDAERKTLKRASARYRDSD